MVSKEFINESLEKSILKTDVQKLVEKRFIEVVKCDNSATHNGANGKVHMANDPDGVEVPKRLLQHKGFDEDGNDLGYIADITYPSGFKIDYFGGKILFPNGEEFSQDVLDNFKTDRFGNVVHDKKGSAEEMLSYQYKEADGGNPRSTRGRLLQAGKLFHSGAIQNLMNDIVHNHTDNEGNLNAELIKRSMDNPIMRETMELYKWMLIHKNDDSMLLDRNSIVTGTQISKKDMNMYDATKINVSSPVPLSASVGRLNDKTINVKNDITGETRSLTGQVNNWDNTWKVYTCITQADGTHAMYLGYPQNVNAGAWDNSGNMYNDVTYFPNQNFKKLLVDKENGIIIQVPNNAPSR